LRVRKAIETKEVGDTIIVSLWYHLFLFG